MKISFDIKFRPQIESGEYKVEIGRDDPWPARIVCWDFDGNNLIVAVRNPNDREEGLIYSIDGKHKAVCPKIDSDLFLITPEPELTEFEKEYKRLYGEGYADGQAGSKPLSDMVLKESADMLLELARKDLPKWRIWKNGACGNSEGHPIAIVKYYGGYKLTNSLGVGGEKYIMLEDLELLPGFEEEAEK